MATLQHGIKPIYPDIKTANIPTLYHKLYKKD